MKRLLLLPLLILSGVAQAQCLSLGGHIFASGGVPVCLSAAAPSEQLLQQANISYVGYFAVPAHGTDPPESPDVDKWTQGGATMWAGPTGGAPGTGSLYLSNDPLNTGRIGIMNIPALPWTGQAATVYAYLGSALAGSTGLINTNTGDYPLNSQFTESTTASSTTMTVSAVTAGTVSSSYLLRGAGIGASCPGIALGTYITSGAGGGTGSYTLSAAATSTASGTCYQNKTEPVISGLIPRSDGNLLVTYYWYYPGGPCCSKNALILSGSDLSTVLQYDQQIGSLSDPSQAGGMVGSVASEWQSALGESYLAGQGTIVANDSRGTIGPTNLAINSNYTYGAGVSVPSSSLTNYPYSSNASQEIVPGWTASGWPIAGTSNFISGLDRGATTFLPHGFSSMVTVGLHGVGPYCYGDPTSTPSLQRTSAGGSIIYCYDLGTDISGSSDKGVHAYPYEYWVWLWKESDVAKVLAGTLQPYQIYPYAAFQLPWPSGTGRTPGNAYTASGAAYYDQTTGYLYMLMSGGESEYIAVWQISTSTSTPLTITCSVCTVTPSTQTLPAATNGSAYSQTISSSGGASPITWHLLYENPSYMPDLSMTTSGVLSSSSITDAAGTYDVMVEATDANGYDAMIGLSLTIH